MSPLLVLCAAWLSETRISDGTGFFELPDSVWAAPGSCWAEAGTDSLAAAPGARGSRTGITVTPAPAAGDTLVLHYATLDLSVPSTASLDITQLGREPMAPRGGATPAGVYEAQPGLFISGVKRLGFSVGHGGGLEQSTSLAISGTIAGDIRVEGVMSDENLPAGGSEAVSELDKVRLGITGRRWSATLGDMEWSRGESGPLAWRRETSGFLGTAGDSVGPGVSGGAGVSGQSHRRALFATQEGVSGPYDFSEGREVVPGSDRVWLDGARLTRGASADYTIDCVAGTITFTESRLIRRDQRVEITYYSRGDGYRRELYTAGAAWVTGGFAIEAASLVESDDRGVPLGFSLSDEAVELLEGAGEEEGDAWVDGATLLGPGQGSYSRDSLGHFVFEGPGLGDWRVVFSRPPSGPGDYLYNSSTGGFQWAGDSLGTHLPRQYLEIPTSLSVGGMALRGGSESLGFTLETSLSRRIGNTFNPSETTREGFSARSRLFASSSDDLGVSLALTGASDGFRPAGVWLGDSVLRSWTLPLDYEGLDEMVEVSAHAWDFDAQAGLLLAEGGGRIARGRLGATPTFGNTGAGAWVEGAQRSGTSVLTEGRYLESGVDFGLLSGRVRPGAGCSVRDESWADSLSGRLATGYAETALSAGGWTSLLRFEGERDWRRGSAELPERTLRGRLEAGTAQGVWRFSGSVEHSTSIWRGGGSTQADALLADLSSSMPGGWIHSVYRGSGTLSREMEVHYRYAGEGEGSYSYDEESGEYYPDPDGDWDVYYTSGPGGGVTEEASLSTEFLAGGALGPSLEGTLDLTSRDAGGRLRTFLLAGAFGRGSGGYSADVSPSWRSAGTMRLVRLRGVIALDRTVYSGAGTREDREARLELSGRAVPDPVVDLAWFGGWWRIDEELYSPRRRVGVRAELDPTFQAGGGFEPGFLAAFERRTEEYSSLEAVMYEAAPHISWNKSGWSASASASAGFIPGDMDLPPWFFDGSDSGTAWTILGRAGRYLSEELSMSLTFYARRPAGSEWVRRAGLEGSVSF